MASIRFFEPMAKVPRTTHNELEIHRSKDGRLAIGKGDRLKQAEAVWRSHLAPHAPEKPLHGPIEAEVTVCWPTDGIHYQGQPMTDKPDLDNVEKVLWDILQREGFIQDDAHVALKRVAKMWRDPSGIYVRLKEMFGNGDEEER